MMKSKVVLPKEVAEAIEAARDRGQSDVFTIHYSVGAPEISFNRTIKRWVGGDIGRMRMLMNALEDGYEVEASPEDRLREYYHRTRREYILESYPKDAKARGRLQGIETTLKILGITVEGIHDSSATPKAAFVTGEEPFDVSP